MEFEPNPKPGRWVLPAILVGATFLRFFRIGHQSLWVDEFLSLSGFTSPTGVPYWKKLLYDVHGPLYSLFMHFWSAVSQSEAWLRAPSAAAGVLAVYLLYRWLTASGRGEVAASGALFMALSPFHIYYSQELRFYAFLSLFVLVTLIAFDRFLRRPSMRTGALLGISLAFTCLSHFSGLFLGAALLAYLAVTGRLRGNHLRYGLLAAGITLGIISPWVYREIANLRTIPVFDISTLPVDKRYRGELTLSAWSYPYILYAFSTGYSFGPDLRELHSIRSGIQLFARYRVEIVLAGTIFGGLFVSGLIRSARRGQFALFATVLAVAIVSLTALTRFNVKVFNVRYLMCVFPFFVTLIAYGLPASRAPRIAIAAAACVVMLVSDGSYYFVARYARDDVRGAASIVSRNEQPGDLIIVPTVRLVFSHYYRGSNVIKAVIPVELGAGGLHERLAGYFDAHPRIWYVRCRHWDTDPDDVLLEALSAQGTVVGSWKLPGILINLYER
jgi:mannosyltransferase